MTNPDDSAQRAAYWPLPLARAVPAAVLALVITFTGAHSARFGLVGFGCFALATGVIVALLASRRLPPGGIRSFVIAQGIISIVLGAAALFFLDGGVPAFFLVVTVWGALTGALELYTGLRMRRQHPASVDWITAGTLTLVAAVVFLLIPPDYADDFVDKDGLSGVIDASVLSVGLLGAYAAVLAVYLLVAAFSAKWGTGATARKPSAMTSEPVDPAAPTQTATTDASTGSASKGDLP